MISVDKLRDAIGSDDTGLDGAVPQEVQLDAVPTGALVMVSRDMLAELERRSAKDIGAESYLRWLKSAIATREEHKV